jgi:predicted metalloprotease
MVALAACGGSDSTDTVAEGPTGPTGMLGVLQDNGQEIENNRGPDGYRELVAVSFVRLGDYWDNQLPDLGVRAARPKRLVSYWDAETDPGCGGRPSGPRNAMYCGPDKMIAWDGNWVGDRLWDDFGNAAAAFLLAHEYGHFVQDRLDIDKEYPLTIEAELNADCLAGAWMGAMDEKVDRLKNVDFKALAAALFNVADPKGVPWVNPSAHGTANERRRALTIGARKGPRACLRELGPGFSL